MFQRPFSDPWLRERYLNLDDIDRWHVTNLLLGEHSPMLWFYVGRGKGRDRHSERQICEQFLDTRFVPARMRRTGYNLGDDDTYHLSLPPIEFPPMAILPRNLLNLVADAGSTVPMHALLERHGLPSTFPEVNELRLQLTTSAFPYLKAVSS